MNTQYPPRVGDTWINIQEPLKLRKILSIHGRGDLLCKNPFGDEFLIPEDHLFKFYALSTIIDAEKIDRIKIESLRPQIGQEWHSKASKLYSIEILFWNHNKNCFTCSDGRQTMSLSTEDIICNYERLFEDRSSLGAKKCTQSNDPINHPSHYTDHPSGIEAIQITEHMNFCLGNAMKYIWRAGKKTHPLTDSTGKETAQVCHDGTTVEDLKKAKWYLEREIKRLGGVLVLLLCLLPFGASAQSVTNITVNAVAAEGRIWYSTNIEILVQHEGQHLLCINGKWGYYWTNDTSGWATTADYMNHTSRTTAIVESTNIIQSHPGWGWPITNSEPANLVFNNIWFGQFLNKDGQCITNAEEIKIYLDGYMGTDNTRAACKAVANSIRAAEELKRLDAIDADEADKIEQDLISAVWSHSAKRREK